MTDTTSRGQAKPVEAALCRFAKSDSMADRLDSLRESMKGGAIHAARAAPRFAAGTDRTTDALRSADDPQRRLPVLAVVGRMTNGALESSEGVDREQPRLGQQIVVTSAEAAGDMVEHSLIERQGVGRSVTGACRVRIVCPPAERLNWDGVVEAQRARTKARLGVSIMNAENENSCVGAGVAKKAQSVLLSLRTHGYAVSEHAGQCGLDAILRQLGEVIYITDVKCDPESRSLVNSSRALDFHTDHPKADYVVWLCVRQSDVGGATILADARAAYLRLLPEERRLLSQVRIFEHKIFADDQDSRPLITLEDGDTRFYYSYWLVKGPLPYDVRLALSKFRRILPEYKMAHIKLRPNDVLVVDNTRMLHGRQAFDGGDRLLKRYWVSKAPRLHRRGGMNDAAALSRHDNQGSAGLCAVLDPSRIDNRRSDRLARFQRHRS